MVSAEPRDHSVKNRKSIWPTGTGQVGEMVCGVVLHRTTAIFSNMVADISKMSKGKDSKNTVKK